MSENESRHRDSLMRKFKVVLKTWLHMLFEQGQRLGFDILPRHFYSEIPELRALRKTAPWRTPYSMLGVDGVNVDEQMAWLRELAPPALQAYWKQNDVHRLACEDNGEEGYGAIEAEVLHGFIVKHKPRRIFQIGCGVSTAVCLRAAGTSYRPRIICVEPHPTEFLRRAAGKKDIELIVQKVQDIDAQRVKELEAGDLFFVDSTHTLGPAGEVTRIVLEFLPRLSHGVYAHFHDIHFPYDYAGDVLDKALFFAHETALLLAFLTLNPHFRILGCLSMLHHRKAQEMKQLFPRYLPAPYIDGVRIGDGHSPSAIYIRRAND